MLGQLLDASIYFSFDASGFRRHAAHFDNADLDRDMRGKICLVTGANSGIGEAMALGLAQRGATVFMLCRNAERGATAQARLQEQTGGDLRLELVDLSSTRSIHAFAERFSAGTVDVLINNAGVLLDSRALTEEGLERTFATNVVGPFLLTSLMAPMLASGGRVINVSSGGMYTQRLNLATLEGRLGSFDGVVAYAQTKRAEVILTELWAERLRTQRTWVNAMHPGWVDTPGVETSLPRFYAFTRKRLRTPQMGADTAVWLAIAERLEGRSGALWFDRAAAPIYPLPRTREREALRAALWARCAQVAGVS